MCAHDQELPASPSSLTPLLREVGELLGHGRVVFLADALEIADPAGSLEALALLAEVEVADPDVPAEIEKALVRVNGDADALDAIVDAQHYRLAKWTVAASELDYRRFFDINSLIALRSERDDVFAATHALIIGWARDGIVDGVRIDHVDGLRDPGVPRSPPRRRGARCAHPRGEDPLPRRAAAGLAGRRDDGIRRGRGDRRGARRR